MSSCTRREQFRWAKLGQTPPPESWISCFLILDPHHHHPLKEIPLPVWQAELYLFSAVFLFMFCPHLHCRNLGLPHVTGVSRAVIYMSLVGPTSIYRELETCPAKLVIWIQPLHYWIAWCSFETVMHISETIHPLQVPQKVWALFQNKLSPKKTGFVKFGSCLILNLAAKASTFSWDVVAKSQSKA